MGFRGRQEGDIMSRISRIIGRQNLRRVLGNPKTRWKRFEEMNSEAFLAGVEYGAERMRQRILSAGAHLDYGVEYSMLKQEE